MLTQKQFASERNYFWIWYCFETASDASIGKLLGVCHFTVIQ